MGNKTRRQMLRNSSAIASLAIAGCNHQGGPTTTQTHTGSSPSPTQSPEPFTVTGSWKRFQRDNENTGYRSKSSQVEDFDNPTTRWSFKTGKIRGSPIVHDGSVYVGSNDSRFYALDAARGEQRWELDTDAEIARSATVRDGSVYFGSEDGKLYAAATDDGSIEWTYDTYDRSMVRSPPAIQDGLLYFGDTEGELYCVKQNNGEVVWKFQTGGSLGIVDAPALGSDTVYATSYDGSLYAVDAEEGSKRWQFKLGDDVAWSAPTLFEDTVYVGVNNRNIYALDANSGTKQWQYETGDMVFQSPAIADGTVYASSRDGSLYALDADSGEHLWRFGTSGPSDPCVVGDTVFIGNGEGKVIAIDAESGRVRWQIRIGSGGVTTPAVVDNVVFASHTDGEVHAIVQKRPPTPTSTPATEPTPTDSSATTSRWWKSSGHDVQNTMANPTASIRQSALGLGRLYDEGGFGPPAIADGEAFMFAGDEWVAFDLESGSRKWSVSTDVERTAPTPTVTEDTIYLHGRKLHAIDRESGNARWTLGGGSRLYGGTSPTVVDGTIFISRSVIRPKDGDLLGAPGVYAVNAADGTRSWYSDEFATESGGLAVAGGSIFGGSSENRVYALSATSGDLEWEFETGHSVLSAPSVADGRVFVGSLDNTLYALDTTDGTVEWKHETFGAVRTTPAVLDGTVYTVSGGVSRTGNVYAIDAATGELQWKFGCLRPVPFYSPIAAGDTVYVQLAPEDDDPQNFGTVFGLDASDGEILSEVDPDEEAGRPFAPVVADGTLYAQFFNRSESADRQTTTETPDQTLPETHLGRIEPDAGTETEETCQSETETAAASVTRPWPSEQHDAANTGRSPGSVSLVFLTTHSNGIHAIDTDSGTVQWTSEGQLTGVQSAPVVANGRVYVGVNRGPYGVSAYDALDGSRLWSGRVGDVKTTPVIDGARGYVGNSGGNLVAFDAENGEQLWTFSGNGRFTSTPALSAGTVYAAGEEGDVYAVEAETGERVWEERVTVEDEIQTPVAVGKNNVYLTSGRATLHAVDISSGTTKWEKGSLQGYGVTGPVVQGDQVYVADDNALVSFSATDGTVNWRYKPESGTPTNAAISGSTAYVGNGSGRLDAVGTGEGSQKWSVDVKSSSRQTPVVSRNHVFVATDKGKVYAINRGDASIEWSTSDLGSADKMWADGTLAAVGGVSRE